MPKKMSAEARELMGKVDSRLAPTAKILGVEIGDGGKAYPLDGLKERACYVDEVNGEPIAVFWYGPTQSAVAFNRKLDGRVLTFYADNISPETAPFKDKETGTRWTLAGRGIDGPLRGKELPWVNSIACNWYAWAAEHPKTEIQSRTCPHTVNRVIQGTMKNLPAQLTHLRPNSVWPNIYASAHVSDS